MQPIVIQSMYGLGDNIFIRPFVRATAAMREVYLITTWPELFEDIANVKFVRPGPVNLRTQSKNVGRQSHERFVDAPAAATRVRVSYGHQQLVEFGITKAIERQLPLVSQPYIFDLPAFAPPPNVPRSKPIAFIRPVTARKEWLNTARNPLAQYVNEIATRLAATHHVVSVADLKPSEEWPEGPLPFAHQSFLNGELPVKHLLGLLQISDIVIGGVGWIVPASIAAKRPAFIILGGQALHNAPKVITDERMDLSLIGYATPDNYCHCSNMRHQCQKSITNLSAQWTLFRERPAIRSSCATLPAI